ncbi:hypothetical protein, variant [Sphaeroforma arctica JP610]|uniref:Beta-1,4-mannosyltransferase n=1 Tax=Sphaeroforma arctica JP610 TaxID=667725 RepID=A0A0L0G8R6_9EUKA|nr:hypothetical protein, variant [Sphaeroforma arctica JP610]KNC85427.1 hypothetical protein, variant [Sphaeroforma arctica JP610]|eukprot:XP_014159329.1 hypothetical protein, variant [Sphaeroforma arctica JP610]
MFVCTEGTTKGSTGNKRACIVVLGDFGRSPRMQFHCASLARHGIDVDVVSYSGSTPHEMITSNQRIAQHSLLTPHQLKAGMPRAVYLFAAVVKTLQLIVTLLYRLLTVPRPDAYLVQTPPAIPALACVKLACLLRNSKMVVDWHNLGYSILALARPESSLLVRIYKGYERLMGPLSDYNFCVTVAMKAWLKATWGVSASTLYDRAPEIFKRLDVNDQHELFIRLSRSHNGVLDGLDTSSTVFTEKKASTGVASLRNDRPLLLVSSTSWTADEDFGVLLKSLEIYDAQASNGTKHPDIVCIITGKGPMKAHYMEVIAQKSLAHVQVYTMWLEAEDYPKLLGAADIGVSLHYSSSGLDLPMKVVDMFGCSLPVCAIDFDCLDELVKDNVNGKVFDTSATLASHFETLFEGFPTHCEKLESLRSGTEEFRRIRWNESWDETAWPIMMEAMR